MKDIKDMVERGVDDIVAAGAQERRTSYYNREPVSVHTLIDVLTEEMDALKSGNLDLATLTSQYKIGDDLFDVNAPNSKEIFFAAMGLVLTELKRNKDSQLKSGLDSIAVRLLIGLKQAVGEQSYLLPNT